MSGALPRLSKFARSLLPDRLNGDVCNNQVSRIDVGVASGDGAKGEEVAIAEMLGHPIEPPPGEGHIRSGKRDAELLRRRIVALVVIGPEAVVEELARVKALPVPITQKSRRGHI